MSKQDDGLAHKFHVDGHNLSLEGRNEQAVQLYDIALGYVSDTNHGGRACINMHKGYALLSLGRYDDAKGAANEVFKYSALSEAQGKNEEHLKKGAREIVDTANSRIAEIKRDNEAANCNSQGLSLLQQGNYQQALDKFQQAYNTRNHQDYKNNIDLANSEIRKDHEAGDCNNQGLELLRLHLSDKPKHRDALDLFSRAYDIRQHEKYKIDVDNCRILVEGDNAFDSGMYSVALNKYKANIFSKDVPEFFVKKAMEICDAIGSSSSSIKITVYEQALMFINTVLDIQANNANALSLKFDIFKSMSEAMMDLKNYDKALDYLKSAEDAGSVSAKYVRFDTLKSIVNAMFSNGRYDKALDYLKLAEEIDHPSRDEELKPIKGNILIKQGKFDEALGCFAESDSGYMEALIGKLKGCEVKIKNDYRDELYDQVLGELDKYFILHEQYNSKPGWPEVNPDIVKIKGGILIKQGKYEEALQYFVEGDIGYKEAKEAVLKENVNKANDSFRHGDYTESLKAYAKSLEVSPNDEACLFGLYASKGYLLAGEHKYVEARDNFMKALEVRPNKEISIAAAECALILKDYENVLKILEGLPVDEKVKQLKSLSYNEVGMAHYNKEEYVDAVKFYKLAVEINPKEITHKNNLGVALIANGEFEEAIKYLESQEDKAIAYNMLGNKHYMSRNYNESLRYYKKANELDSHDITYKNNIGYALLNSSQNQQELSQVLNNFDQILIEDRLNERGLQGKELILQALLRNTRAGDLDKMLGYYDELIATSQLLYRNPDPQYLFEKARLLAEVTQHTEAIKILEQAINIDKNYSEAVELLQQLNCIVGNTAVIERHGDGLGDDDITNKVAGADSIKIGGNYDDEL